MSGWGKEVYLVLTGARWRWSHPISPQRPHSGPLPRVFLLQGLNGGEELNAFLQTHWCLLQHVPDTVMLHVALGWGNGWPGMRMTSESHSVVLDSL